MSQKATCPACGGPVTFRVGTSLVTVCPYCHSAVGRGDRGLESLGKVADLVQTESPLDVGMKGRFEGKPFSLAGRTQYNHPAGGVWDEWYAAFADGRWGWLAEAQGRFYMTFETAAPDVPAYDRLALGQAIDLAGQKLTVAEKNTAAVAGALGEMPTRIAPGKPHPFADLSGPRGEFATLDYSGPRPAAYLGREVTLDELQIPNVQRRTYPGQEPKVAAVALNCPKCAAALSLRAPDKSERVGCPSCGSLLDVKDGKLSLLRSLEPPEVEPVLALGSVGKHQGVEWTVLGFLRRYVIFDGTTYYWEEYLLYQPRLGFRWLTRSDEHWNWVENVPPAAVSVEGRIATYGGRSFTLFQAAEALVSVVLGGFYWKVEAGERVDSCDFVRAPQMLSREVTKDGDEGEVNWSRAEYLRADEVEAMFGLKEPLPRPTTIGPNQPFGHAGVYPVSAVLLALALAVGIFFWSVSPSRKVGQWGPPLPAGVREHRVLVEEPVPLRGDENVELRLRPSGTGWMHVKGTLTPGGDAPRPGEATRPSGESRLFEFAAMGGQSQGVYLSAVPEGEYRLEYTLTWKDTTDAAACELTMRQGVPHGGPFVVVLLLIAAVPVLVGVYQLYFEAQRWKDSNTNG